MYIYPSCDYYIYEYETGDEESGITPGTAYENLPDEFVYPDCGESKESFKLL